MTRADRQVIYTSVAYASVLISTCNLLMQQGSGFKAGGNDEMVARIATDIEDYYENRLTPDDETLSPQALLMSARQVMQGFLIENDLPEKVEKPVVDLIARIEAACALH